MSSIRYRDHYSDTSNSEDDVTRQYAESAKKLLAQVSEKINRDLGKNLEFIYEGTTFEGDALFRMQSTKTYFGAIRIEKAIAPEYRVACQGSDLNLVKKIDREINYKQVKDGGLTFVHSLADYATAWDVYLAREGIKFFGNTSETSHILEERQNKLVDEIMGNLVRIQHKQGIQLGL